MALPKEKLYTVDDIYALSDGTRAELIDGEMYMMTPPGRKHQELVSFLKLGILFVIRMGIVKYTRLHLQSFSTKTTELM